MINYFLKQYEQVANGGWPVFFQKLRSLINKLFMDLPLYVFAIPVVLFVRLVRPVVLIRFGSLNQAVIGDFVFDTESYLSERELSNDSSLDLFWYRGNYLSNYQWKIMAERNMRIHPLAKYMDKINDVIPGRDIHKVIIRPFGVVGASSRDYKDVFYHTKSQVVFTQDEIDQGQAYLKDIGIDSDGKIVCIINRDNSYKNTYQKKIKSDWSYHDHRNSNINNYIKTVNHLAKNGYWVFRMGKGVEDKLDCNDGGIVNYATSNDRSDFLDIFLFSSSYFCICSESGMINLTYAFRKPLCNVNIASVGYLQNWHDNNLLIFKKYWLKNEKRFMTFKEIFDSGVGRLYRCDQFNDHDIELIENSPEEILDVSVEMYQRLNGTWNPTDEDKKLQSAFKELYPKDKYTPVFRARIGAKFLRQNQDLLFN